MGALPRLIGGPLGFEITDLFAQVGFNTEEFRDEIEQLPYVPPLLSNEWRKNPEAGLPDPEPDSRSDAELLPCLDEDELATRPRPECVIEGLLLAGRPTLFTGQQNLGKTALAYDFCLSISRGLPWNGRATKKGPTFFLAAEGADGAYPRILGWKQFHAIEHKPDFRVITVPVAFDEPAELERLIRRLQDLNQTDNPTVLIVIDTLALCLNEANENDSGDMTRFVRAASEICTATGAAVLIIHHNNRGNTYRGASSLPANCYGHLALDGDDEKICHDVLKIKDYNHRQRFWLRPEIFTIEGLQDNHGKPVTSVVFVPLEKDEANGDGGNFSSGASRAQAKFKSSAKSNASGKPPKSPGELSEKEAATWQALLTLNANAVGGVTSGDWATAAKKLGVSVATFERAKKKLQDLGKVEREDSGKTGPRFTPRL